MRCLACPPRLQSQDPELFQLAKVGLGCLGVVAEVTLQVSAVLGQERCLLLLATSPICLCPPWHKQGYFQPCPALCLLACLACLPACSACQPTAWWSTPGC